jgi:hypothetical protein
MVHDSKYHYYFILNLFTLKTIKHGMDIFTVLLAIHILARNIRLLLGGYMSIAIKGGAKNKTK